MTLIELIFSLSIIIIITFMSYYGFSSYVIQKKTMAIQTTLFHFFQFARIEAIFKNTVIIVSYNESENQLIIATENPYEIKRLFRLPSGYRLKNNRPLGFRFSPQGQCSTPGTITIISKNSSRLAEQIIINDSGRPRLITSSVLLPKLNY